MPRRASSVWKTKRMAIWIDPKATSASEASRRIVCSSSDLIESRVVIEEPEPADAGSHDDEHRQQALAPRRAEELGDQDQQQRSGREHQRIIHQLIELHGHVQGIRTPRL